MATDILAHIPENQLSADVFETFCNSVSIGPVKISFCVDTSTPRITVDIYLSGTRIGGGVLDPQHTTITVGGGIAGVRAEVKLEADFAKKRITYEIKVCLPVIGCRKLTGTLFSW